MIEQTISVDNETDSMVDNNEKKVTPVIRVAKSMPPQKKVAISDNLIISSMVTEDLQSIFSNEKLSDEEKLDKFHFKLKKEEDKLNTLSQRAAIDKCVDSIRDIRQYINIVKNGGEVDDEEDMDVFDMITLNAKQVATKRSNSLIITGDAGVGKTKTVIDAISYLNPIPETVIEESIEETSENNPEEEIQPNWVFTDNDKQTIETSDSTEEDDDVEEIEEITSSEEKPIIISKKQPPKKNKGVNISKTTVQSRNNVQSGYYIASGTCTSAALYELLWNHRTKLLVFDDFDSIFKDDDSVNMLKAALDTYEVREISKMTKGNSFNSFGMTDAEMQEEYDATSKVPNQFKFSGNIIFISNIHEDKFDKALISRSLHVEVRLSRTQIIERMRKLMVQIRPLVDLNYKIEALDHLEYLTSNFPCKFDLNLRELIHAIDYKAQYPEDKVTLGGKEVFIWKQLLKKRIVKSKNVR